MNNQTVPTNWPDLAISLYDRLTGRNAEIAYDFEDFKVEVPHSVGENPQHATWRMNGLLKVRTQSHSQN